MIGGWLIAGHRADIVVLDNDHDLERVLIGGRDVDLS